ncbi:MAG: hypothetical protein GY946_01790 [bacterium]|nr:hypothetical protein [bacterium]
MAQFDSTDTLDRGLDSDERQGWLDEVDALPDRLALEHAKTEVVLDAIVKSHYRRSR